MSDAVSVVRKLPVRNDNYARVENSQIPPQRNCTNIQLPAWIDNSANFPAPGRSALPLSHQPTYIFCGDEIMTRISRVEYYTLSKIYGSFFNQLFTGAKDQKLVRGTMNYKALTLPWLLRTVKFGLRTYAK